MRPEGLLCQSSAPKQTSNSCSCCRFGLEIQPSLAKMEQGTVPGIPLVHGEGLLFWVSGGVRELIHPWVFVKHLQLSSIRDWRSITKSQKLDRNAFVFNLPLPVQDSLQSHSGSVSEKRGQNQPSFFPVEMTDVASHALKT